MGHTKRAVFITATMFLMLFIGCVGGDEEIKIDPFSGKMMVHVKGGTFTMGCTPEQDIDCSESEQPAHQVTLSDYYIGRYPVTQGQWKLVMNGDNPSKFQGDSLPVENVSWYDVRAFIWKLNEMSGGNYRLPTEAEWEYAARGGVQSKGYKFSGSDIADEVAWYGPGETTRSVGIKMANELGIYDMSGNVWEWVNDWYNEYNIDPKTNPQGPNTGVNRVLRGGSWSNIARYTWVSVRNGGIPNFRRDTIGFRIAYSPEK